MAHGDVILRTVKVLKVGLFETVVTLVEIVVLQYSTV